MVGSQEFYLCGQNNRVKDILTFFSSLTCRSSPQNTEYYISHNPIQQRILSDPSSLSQFVTFVTFGSVLLKAERCQRSVLLETRAHRLLYKNTNTGKKTTSVLCFSHQTSNKLLSLYVYTYK